MNRWLIIASVVLLVAAAVLWITTPKPRPTAAGTTRTVDPASGAPTTTTGCPHDPPVATKADPAAGSPPATGPTATLGGSVPIGALPPADFKPAKGTTTTFDQACGRPRQRSLPVQKDAAITLPVMPEAGEVEILVRSTMGGVEVQKHVVGRFRALADGQIEVSGILPDETLRIGYDRGVLRLVAPPAGLEPATSNAVVEVARTALMLRSALLGGPVTATTNVTLGGDPYRLVQAEGGRVILAATRDANEGAAFIDRYPAIPGAWNDVCAWVDDQGRMLAIERLAATPETADEAGFLVRRTVFRFTPPKPPADGQ